jgi:hypothetical protein
MQGVRPYMLISEKNWWLRLHRFGLKSRRDDLFIEDADATQFFFLFFSGAGQRSAVRREFRTRAAEKQKENHLGRLQTINRSSPTGLRTTRMRLWSLVYLKHRLAM